MYPNLDKKFDFQNLFILDMANNHQGLLGHGLRIIQEFTPVVKEAGVRAAIKFQFRDLDTFIHPNFRNSPENKHIPRFLSTRLSKDDFRILNEEIKKAGLITIATPFDEKSVDFLEQLGIEIIKIGSCSATDWPLLERIVETGKPIVCSVAGLSLGEIDNLVSFFDHRGAAYALMHCVAIYPTPKEKLNLNRIRLFRARYPHIPIGFSTHEDPDNLEAIKVAYVNGARLFERHIGVPTEEIKLNAYSSTPEQLKKWLASYQETILMLGSGNLNDENQEERKSLESLMRGVYTKRDIKQGERITSDDVFFAMPLQSGQMRSGQWKNPVVAPENYSANQPLPASLVAKKSLQREIIYKAIHDVKGMLNMARIFPGYESSVELSHHYGLENFDKVGAVLIDCINREYCKKLVIVLPGQSHPYHYHKKKEETFQVLSGQVEMMIEGIAKTFYPGEIILVPRGVWHGFSSKDGAIFEEISTTSYSDDSYYADQRINQMSRDQRKTKLINWGRHQFDEDEK